MRTLPKVVGNTEVGKSVQLKIWRNKKLISKRLVLGRLESTAEFKEKKSLPQKINKSIDIEGLKINVRDINETDKSQRNLRANQTGSIINEIYQNSPLKGLLNKNDIIIEVQKKSIQSSSELDRVITNIINKNESTVLLTIINSSNQRRYLGVKIK